MPAMTGCFEGLCSRLSPRGASSPHRAEGPASRNQRWVSYVPDMQSFNRAAARDAIGAATVAQNAARVARMLDRFERALRHGEPMPDTTFAEQVMRPFVTWLKALTYLPDEGEFTSVAPCAQALLEHVPMPDSHERRPLREFGSTERLDARDDEVRVARSFVVSTIPLLQRFVSLLEALATGLHCNDRFARLLDVIRGRVDGQSDSSDNDEPVYATVAPRERRPSVASSHSDASPERLDMPPPLPARLVIDYGVLTRGMPRYLGPPEVIEELDDEHVEQAAANEGWIQTAHFCARSASSASGSSSSSSSSGSSSASSLDMDSARSDDGNVVAANANVDVDTVDAVTAKQAQRGDDAFDVSRAILRDRPSRFTVRAEVHARTRSRSPIATCPTASGRPASAEVRCEPWDSRTRKSVVVLGDRPPTPEIDYDSGSSVDGSA